jgi:hypothetical protein
MESAVIDFPDPDSPTSANVDPLSIEKLIPFTTLTIPAGVLKQV